MGLALQAIYSQTVGAGGAASVTFNNIPQTFTDLVLVCSARSSGTGSVGDYIIGSFNGTTAGYSARELFGDGSSVGSGSYTSGTAARILTYANSTNATSNTFGNSTVYIPNYAGTTNKTWSSDGVMENNATASRLVFMAGLWSNTAAITSVSLSSYLGGTWVQNSTFSLYGINRF